MLSPSSFLVLCSLAFAIGNPMVATPLGKIEGVSGNGYDLFAGIPYGQGPYGNLRFRPARPVDPWGGVLLAHEYQAACMQRGSRNMSEDCLFLNVWRPQGAHNVTEDARLPVMVWIHGGSFQSGAGSDYNASKLAGEGVIVVTINYRLGAFGYYTSEEVKKEDAAWPALGGGNGINDQVVALAWVQDNIQAFGGDPSRVTIFGESAGSLSVCMLLTSPRASGLFAQAAMESGSCIGPWGPAPTDFALPLSADFLNASGAANLAGLRDLTAQEILHNPHYALGPSLDGWVLPHEPALAFLEGNLTVPRGSPMLLGSNTQDTLFAYPYYAGPWPDTAAEYAAKVTQFFGLAAEAVLVEYPPGKTAEETNAQYALLNADTCVVCPTKWLADILSSGTMTSPTYVYRYGIPSSPHAFGAAHASELPQVFDYDMVPGVFPYVPTTAAAMKGLWASFAKNGAPSADGISWPRYKAVEEAFLYFDAEGAAARSGYSPVKCGTLGSIFENPMGRLAVASFCFQQKV